MDNFIELITKENITFTLALLGSLGTLISGVFHLFNNRKKLIFEINSFFSSWYIFASSFHAY